MYLFGAYAKLSQVRFNKFFYKQLIIMVYSKIKYDFFITFNFCLLISTEKLGRDLNSFNQLKINS